MATDLHVPTQYHTGFQSLAKLDDPAFEDLVNALEALPPVLLPQELARRVGSSPGLGGSDVDQLLVAVLSLFPLAEHLDRSEADIAETIAHSPELELDAPTASRLSDRLNRIFHSRTLAVSAKALAVVTAHEHPFHHVRILSDIRPVFMANAAERPPAAAIVHTMDLGLHRRDGTVEHLQVAMDIRDVRLLRRAVERAEVKERTLRSVCKESGMDIVEQEPV